MNSQFSSHNKVTKDNREHKALSVIHRPLWKNSAVPRGSAAHMSGTTELRESMDPEVIYRRNISPSLISVHLSSSCHCTAPEARWLRGIQNKHKKKIQNDAVCTVHNIAMC